MPIAKRLTAISLLLGAALLGAEAASPKITGFPIPSDPRVPDNIIVTSVMIPPREVSRIFGGAVAKTHAVVQIIVANQSSENAFILKSLAIDYSRWPLANCQEENVNASALTGPHNPKLLDQADAYGKPCRVSSVDVNAMWLVTRDGASKDWRNVVYRSLAAAGSITGAGAIAFEGTLDLVRGATAWSSTVPAGFRGIFPDRSLEHLNFLQSNGFRPDTLVPKSAAVSVYAFFPIHRFLGGRLTKYYLDDPAIFFSPQQFLLDKRYDPFFDLLIQRFGVENPRERPRLDDSVPDPIAENRKKEHERIRTSASTVDTKNPIDPKFNINLNESLRTLLHTITLNRISIVATGEMVIAVSDLGPEITTLSLAKEDFNLAFTGTKVKAAIKGKNLREANFTVTGAKVTVKTIEATDTAAEVELTLGEPFKPFETVLEFRASRKAGSQTLESRPFSLPIKYDRPTATVADLKVKADDVKSAGFTVAGTNLSEGAVTAQLKGTQDFSLVVTSAKREELKFQKATLPEGKYTLLVSLPDGRNALATVEVIK